MCETANINRPVFSRRHQRRSKTGSPAGANLWCRYARPRAASSAISTARLMGKTCGRRKASASEPPLMSSVTRMKGSFLVQAPRNCRQGIHDVLIVGHQVYTKGGSGAMAWSRCNKDGHTCTALGWCTRRRISISPRKSPSAISLEPFKILAATNVPYLSEGQEDKWGLLPPHEEARAETVLAQDSLRVQHPTATACA